MIRSSPRRFGPAWLAGFLACVPLVSLVQPPDILAGPPTAKEIEQLIRDLGSDHFEVREAAAKRLQEADEIPPALYEARKLPDSEVRRRVADILLALKRRHASRGLARAKVLSRAGRIVEAADRIVAAGEGDTKGEGWDNLTRFADRVIEDARRYFPADGGSFRSDPNFPAGEFRRFAERVHPKEICKRTITIDASDRLRQFKKADFDLKFVQDAKFHLLLRGEEVSWLSDVIPLGMNNGILAASGDVQLVSACGSVLIAGGDVKKVSHLYRCILVCDGDVELPSHAACYEESLIVARGKVTYPRGEFDKCMVRSGRSLRLPDGTIIDLTKGKHDPLAFVKFFELADVGLTADPPARPKPDAGPVRLKAVSQESPFASGLRAGDRVMAVDGTKVTSTEHFRRLLRRKLAQGDPLLTFTVRRAKETVDVTIPIKH